MKRLTLPLVLLLALTSGCASHKIKDVPVNQLEGYGCYTKIDDVEIAADLYAETQKTKEVFSADLNKAQFFPVHVIVKNDTDGRVLILRSGIALSDTVGSEYKHVSSAAMCEEFAHNKMAYALLGFGIFSYMSAEDANTKMKADWSDKEFSEEMIVNAGRVNSGFVYLKLPEGSTPEGKTLSIEVEDMETNARQVVKLQL
ncbi:MAG: hypothetical protein KKE73_02755 [Proteobacteria bacterium]|nr:hypothetical protein [Pseudomonadota bacterium]